MCSGRIVPAFAASNHGVVCRTSTREGAETGEQMAKEVNKFGLSRYIPAAIELQVRQECGFGCVICGNAFTTYEHFDPPFKDATVHRASGIALLCWGCHGPKTSGFWSVQKVARARMQPKALEAGYSSIMHDLYSPFVLSVGSSSVEGVSTIIRTREGERWFSIAEPEESGGPMRLSVVFFDEKGQPSFEIRENEVRCLSGRWDTDFVGGTFTVRNGPGEICLEVEFRPQHELLLHRLEMRKEDLSVVVERNGRWTVERAGGLTTMRNCLFQTGDAVFVI
jgi:hypothetical protein